MFRLLPLLAHRRAGVPPPLNPPVDTRRWQCGDWYGTGQPSATLAARSIRSVSSAPLVDGAQCRAGTRAGGVGAGIGCVVGAGERIQSSGGGGGGGGGRRGGGARRVGTAA